MTTKFVYLVVMVMFRFIDHCSVRQHSSKFFVPASKLNMAFSKIRDIDSTFKDIVFQYIGQHEKDNKSLKIPMMLKYLCLQYYLIQEYFVGLPKSQMVINNKISWESNLLIYGNNETININDTSISKYIWTLKVLSMEQEPMGSGFIGLWSTKLQSFDLIPQILWEPYRFGLSIHETCYFLREELPNKRQNGDIIEIILDIKNTKLGFIINGGDIIDRFSNVIYWQNDREWLNELGLKLVIQVQFQQSYQFTSFRVEHN